MNARPFRNILVFFICLLLALPLAAQEDKPADIVVKDRQLPFTFVAWGDMRITNNRIERGSNRARRALVEAIAKEKPAFTVISGDLVLTGDNMGDWGAWDDYMKPIGDAGVQQFPALGNHDLHGELNVALDNYFKRFPMIGKHRWYTMQQGNAYFLMMDSQSDMEPNSEQGKWIRERLDKLPEEVEFVFAVMHHPIYTRSKKTWFQRGHEPKDNHVALGKFFEERQKKMKARIIVVSGHVHNYERYQHDNVVYVVTGGGGATQHSIPREPEDYYQGKGNTYHYCRFKVEKGKLTMEMVKLMSLSDPNYEVRDKFEILIPAERPALGAAQ